MEPRVPSVRATIAPVYGNPRAPASGAVAVTVYLPDTLYGRMPHRVVSCRPIGRVNFTVAPMRPCRCALFAAAFAVIGASQAPAFDMAHVTCGGFFASGPANMKVIIMWLRGYHAGKSGIIARTSTAEMRAYGGKLGHYCRMHPNARVIDASEQILTNEDQGI
ncbi:MAG TPA: HdeA/HdeB family chaperone [Stellaceae bacterium]|nr:HdeA/HdeB family chaperone [Stellaceae bacterium]